MQNAFLTIPASAKILILKIQDGGATPASTKTTISQRIYHRVNLSQRKH